MLSFLSLAVSSRSLVETNKYLLFSFLTLRNDKTQVAEAEVAEMAAEVAAEDAAFTARTPFAYPSLTLRPMEVRTFLARFR